MASSKSNDSTNSGLQDANSDTNDEGKNELCPGFKDVDAFVKVSERRKRDAECLSSEWQPGGQRGCVFWLRAVVTL